MASILLPFDTNRWDAKEWDLNPHSDLFVGLVACAMPTPEVGVRGLAIDGTWNKLNADGTSGVLRDILGGAAWCTTSSGSAEFRLDISQSVITAAPISLAFVGTKNHNHTGSSPFNIMSADNSASANNRDRVALYGSGGQLVGIRVASDSSATNGPLIDPGMPFGKIGCAVGVYKTATEYWSAVNGSKATTSTTSRIPTGINRLSIGSISTSVWPFILKSGLWWNRALSEAESIELSRDYRVLFRPKKRILYFSTSSSTTIRPAQGSLVVTGQSPTISKTANVFRSPAQGSLTITGQAPTVSKTVNIQCAPTQGSLLLTGQTPVISRTEHLWRSIGQGSIVITGQAPTITTYAGITRQPGQGSLTLIGQAPSIGITAHHRVAPQAGQIVLDGLAPVVTNTTPPLFTQDQLDFLLAYMEANLMIWDEPIEGVMTAREMMRILLAAIAGKRAGLGTATEQYMAQDGTTPRVTFTPTDASGNGNTVLDGS